VNGGATISIYDFANQLVREMRIPASGIRAGERYTTSMTWDGYNGEGDRVAIGAYFFVVEYADGSTDWGKFAVIH
jgi:flagellar hook assembly protein FlgD